MAKNRQALILGIDLGGTKILTAVTNAQGKMLSRDHSVTPAKEGQQAVVKSILESIGRALEQAQISETDVWYEADWLLQETNQDSMYHRPGDWYNVGH